MALLWNDCNEQASSISDGVVEIRINIHLAREQHDDMTHVSHIDTTSSHLS
jgi:hypothetical protein